MRKTSALIVVALLASATSQAAPARKIVVIDPGHGGTNTGARGPASNVYEKRLTLKLAKLVAKRLRALRADVDVALTRKVDRYLTLQQRVRMANELDAALFVSLHFNASKSRSQRGFETFVLSSQASDQEAKRIAMRESAYSAKKKAHNAIASILADLKQRTSHRVSARLGLAIQHRLQLARGKGNNRGLRQAPFDVLMGLTMPGALVEVGFIDHPVEGKEVIRDATQAQLADAVAQGIIDYLYPQPPRKKKRRRRRRR